MQLTADISFFNQVEEIMNKIFRITKRILVSNHQNRGAQKAAYLDYWNDTTQKLIK